uniref:Latrophilin-2 n=1 Tax=Lygus hesperus TaxID=30085 RepID=A0A0A9W693_LYGHE
MDKFLSSLLVGFSVFVVTEGLSQFSQGWKHIKKCGHQAIDINCGSDHVVQFHTVFYGRYEAVTTRYCQFEETYHYGRLPPWSCHLNEFYYKRMMSCCQGKHSCRIINGWGTAHNPCYNWLKFTELRYECVPERYLVRTAPSTDWSSTSRVIGGYDELTGRELYVGRTVHDGNVLPCYVKGDECIYSLNGQYGRNSTFVYLKSNNLGYDEDYKWLLKRGGDVPPAAVPFGQTNLGKPWFVGRAAINGGLYVGKVVPGEGLYVGYKDFEVFLKDYEILVQ